MKSQEYIDLENRYGAHNYKPLNVVLTRGEGIWVWDVDGNRYMDCLSAYSAVNQGHCHPAIMQTMVNQARLLTLTSRAFRNDQLGLFYKEVCELTHSHKMLPMNSGAEAVETVIKAVRKWGYKVKGIPVPVASLMKNPANQTVVWVKTAPERFEPRTVTTEPLDGVNAAVTSGLEPGDRVATQGATLINQVR